jgi:hypothetical protein
MIIYALLATAVVLVALHLIARIFIGARHREQSLLDMECEMLFLDAECSRAMYGTAEESSVPKQAS